MWNGKSTQLGWLIAALALVSWMGVAAAQTDAKSDLLKALTQQNDAGALGSGVSDEELPDPAIAFVPSAQMQDANTLVATWEIQDCCYLYRKRFKFESATSGITLGTPVFPPGEIIEDEFFGNMETYRGRVQISIPVTRAADAPDQLDLAATFQGCADIGVCYPPQQQTLPILLAAAGNAGTSAGTAIGGGADRGLASPIQSNVTAAAGNSLAVTTALAAGKVSEQDRVAGMLLEQRFFALPMFFLLGLGLAFTPCVFPMIPILSGIIAGRGDNLTQSRAFTLSLVYVLAMAATYTVAGVAAALMGQNIQVWFQNPWVLVTFSGVFVLLAMSMFGFFELQVPASWQTRLSALSNRQGGGYTGVAVMGVLSALIVGPCVAPPLIGALTVIGSTGDATLGGSALFVMSLGMGAPLLVLGTSAGKWLPRAGAWMDAIKAVFGVLLLAVAIWLLERIIPAVATMILWATLLIVSAVYMGALQSAAGFSGWRTLSKGLGTVMLVYGVLLLVGVAAGGRDTLQPLRGVLLAGGASPGAISQSLEFKYIKTAADLDSVLAAAGGRPVMLDFYADWCISCKEMDRFTFSDSTVQASLSGTILLKADVTANDAADQALLQRFGLIGPPATLFFGADGVEMPGYRVVGFMPAGQFAGHVREALQPQA